MNHSPEMFYLAYLMQQQVSAQSSNPLDNTAVQVAVVIAGGVLVQSIFKDVQVAVHTLFTEELPKRLESGRKKRMAELKILEAQIAQNEKLFAQNEKLFSQLELRDEQIEARDKKLLEFANTLVEAQRLNNEQRATFNQERQDWRAERIDMSDTIKSGQTVIEQLTEANRLLKEENDRLKRERETWETERQRLLDQLKKYETSEHSAVIIPPSQENAATAE